MDAISTEDTHAPRRNRKALVIALLLVPVIAVASLLAFVKAQETLGRYPFLRESALVVDRQVDIGVYSITGGTSKAPAMRYRVYNIPQSLERILPAARKDLTADGWREMKTARPKPYSEFMKEMSPSPSGVPNPGASSIYLMPGRAVMLPKGAAWDPNQTAESCTAMVVTEEYKPTWLQAVYDRITGAKPVWVGEFNVRIVSPASRKP